MSLHDGVHQMDEAAAVYLLQGGGGRGENQGRQEAAGLSAKAGAQHCHAV